MQVVAAIEARYATTTRRCGVNLDSSRSVRKNQVHSVNTAAAPLTGTHLGIGVLGTTRNVAAVTAASTAATFRNSRVRISSSLRSATSGVTVDWACWVDCEPAPVRAARSPLVP